MTDMIETAPPSPRLRPARPPRQRPARHANGIVEAQHIGGAVEQDDDQTPAWARRLEAKIDAQATRVDALESGGMRTVPTEPEPKAEARAVQADALDPFTRKLWEERTHDTPENYGGDREPAYNVAPRLYLKNDGTYVQLQGDAKSRAYYADKGFYCCSPDEAIEYEKLKPGIVAVQREKARLITAIRRLIDTDAALVGHRGDNDFDVELDLMSTDQLRLTWRQLNAETSQPDRPLPPPKRWRSEGRDHQIDGVETSDSTSKEEFDAKLDQARRSGRLAEVTSSNYNQFA